MSNEEIQKCNDREKLKARLLEKDVRKVERRLLKRKIKRLRLQVN